ncbi:MAG TPA: hypothetical protein VMR66_11755 [Gemmatimonadota bacterium]|nr:hypothetical protein [Gemmatimonadota bacterium]
MSARTRRLAWILGGAALLVILAWVVTLPMRQTRFQVVEHALVPAGEEVEIRGRLRNRGAEARNVLVEAYLYDDGNRWLGTAQSRVARAAADSTISFVIPVEPRLARSVERYSLYAGLQPNPFAPGM